MHLLEVAVETLRRFFAYNAWANARVVRVCTDLDPAALGAEAAGTIGTLEETLKHFTAVEDGYLAMLRGADPGETFGAREAYLAQEFGWFLHRLAELGNGYTDLLAGEDTGLVERPISLPWLASPMSGREGMIQVLSHSAHHRAQVLSVLGARGVQVPDLDYVFMLAEGAAASA